MTDWADKVIDELFHNRQNSDAPYPSEVVRALRKARKEGMIDAFIEVALNKQENVAHNVLRNHQYKFDGTRLKICPKCRGIGQRMGLSTEAAKGSDLVPNPLQSPDKLMEALMEFEEKEMVLFDCRACNGSGMVLRNPEELK